MKRVTLCVNKPRYDSRRYQVTWRKFDDLGEVWTGRKGAAL